MGKRQDVGKTKTIGTGKGQDRQNKLEAKTLGCEKIWDGESKDWKKRGASDC